MLSVITPSPYQLTRDYLTTYEKHNPDSEKKVERLKEITPESVKYNLWRQLEAMLRCRCSIRQPLTPLDVLSLEPKRTDRPTEHVSLENILQAMSFWKGQPVCTIIHYY